MFLQWTLMCAPRVIGDEEIAGERTAQAKVIRDIYYYVVWLW